MPTANQLREAVAPFGIRRGEPGSQAAHSEVRLFFTARCRQSIRCQRGLSCVLSQGPRATERRGRRGGRCVGWRSGHRVRQGCAISGRAGVGAVDSACRLVATGAEQPEGSYRCSTVPANTTTGWPKSPASAVGCGTHINSSSLRLWFHYSELGPSRCGSKNLLTFALARRLSFSDV